MITLKDADGIPVSWRRRLEDLAARYPVGVKVRHESGWTGTVAAGLTSRKCGSRAQGLISTSSSGMPYSANISRTRREAGSSWW